MTVPKESTPPQVSLRERKKRRTREAISNAAIDLFAERDFEAVTIAEIAEAADVSQKTVFNYFPTKEDLVYERQAAVEEQLLQTVREQGAVDGMRTFLTEVFSRLGEKGAPDVMATRARIIGASPALQTREREVFESYTRALAAVLAEQRGGEPEDVRAFVTANALLGVNRALLDSARRKVLAGRRGKRLVEEILEEADEALTLLERGLRAYAKKPR